MNFGQIKSMVADWLNRADLTLQIPDFINMGMKTIERADNYNCMEVWESVAISNTGLSDDCYVSMPMNYKATKWMKILSNGAYFPVRKKQESDVLNEYPNTVTDRGRPVYFSSIASTSEFLLRPGPDTTYTLEGTHYVYTTDFINDSDTNWWTQSAWECLLYAALVEASPYLGEDSRIGIWQGKFTEKKKSLKDSEMLEKTGETDLQIRGQFVV